MKNSKETKKGENTMEGKYLNPTADLTFKLVFGEHPDLVMSLLNALLPLEADQQITTVEYLTPEMVPENPGKKDSVVDVRCKDQKGRQFIVEMQMYWNRSFLQRVLLNASKAVVKQLKGSEDYHLVQPVYCLTLINDIGFKTDDNEFYHDYAIVNVAHTDRIIEGLRFVFVELPKFKPKSISEKKMAVLWLRFLTEINRATEEAPAELLENADTAKALRIVEKSAMSDAQLYAYERFWMAVVDEREIHETLKERGYKKGRAEGRAEGEAKGRAEEKISNARNLKANGVPADVIAKSLCLSQEEIEKL